MSFNILTGNKLVCILVYCTVHSRIIELFVILNSLAFRPFIGAYLRFIQCSQISSVIPIFLPPMTISSLHFFKTPGHNVSALAKLVRGPMATRVRFCLVVSCSIRNCSEVSSGLLKFRFDCFFSVPGGRLVVRVFCARFQKRQKL